MKIPFSINGVKYSGQIICLDIYGILCTRNDNFNGGIIPPFLIFEHNKAIEASIICGGNPKNEI